MVVREEEVFAIGAKGELEDAHSRKIEIVAEFFDGGGDEAEVFGDERETADGAIDCTEELAARGFDPSAVPGGAAVGGDLPAGLEAAEVIDSDEIAMSEGCADAADPPVESGTLHGGPVVEGIAPALAGLGEIIGRDPRDDFWPATAVEQEEVGVGPDIGRVGGDEHGQVADDANAVPAGVGAEAGELAEEQELGEGVTVDVIGKFSSGGMNGDGVSRREFGRPAGEFFATAALADRKEQRVVFEPGGMAGSGRISIVIEVREGRGDAEGLPRVEKYAVFERVNLGEIHAACGQRFGLTVSPPRE